MITLTDKFCLWNSHFCMGHLKTKYKHTHMQFPAKEQRMKIKRLMKIKMFKAHALPWACLTFSGETRIESGFLGSSSLGSERT